MPELFCNTLEPSFLVQVVNMIEKICMPLTSASTNEVGGKSIIPTTERKLRLAEVQGLAQSLLSGRKC